MSEQDTQNTKEAQKTVIAFIAGLVIGGLLVFAFGGTSTPTDDRMDDDNDVSSEAIDTNDVDEDSEDEEDDSDTEVTGSNTIETGDAAARVSDQDAGSVVAIDSATFPTDEGWIGVRDYDNDEIGNILGVVRYSKSQGLTPSQVRLQRATVAGKEYAIVFFENKGDRSFSAATDTQIGGVADTFRAE